MFVWQGETALSLYLPFLIEKQGSKGNRVDVGKVLASGHLLERSRAPELSRVCSICCCERYCDQNQLREKMSIEQEMPGRGPSVREVKAGI